jgi:hypothetical protein
MPSTRVVVHSLQRIRRPGDNNRTAGRRGSRGRGGRRPAYGELSPPVREFFHRSRRPACGWECACGVCVKVPASASRVIANAALEAAIQLTGWREGTARPAGLARVIVTRACRADRGGCAEASLHFLTRLLARRTPRVLDRPRARTSRVSGVASSGSSAHKTGLTRLL